MLGKTFDHAFSAEQRRAVCALADIFEGLHSTVEPIVLCSRLWFEATDGRKLGFVYSASEGIKFAESESSASICILDEREEKMIRKLMRERYRI